MNYITMDDNRDKAILILGIVVLFILSILYFVCAPIGVDTSFHTMRVGELGKELGRIGKLGDFPIYIYRDVYFHYGYPIPIFYCAIFLYPFAILVLLGLDSIIAYRIMVIALLWLCYFISYRCAYYWTRSRKDSYLAAFVYALQPYFLMDLFVKASIGEAFAFLFVPLIVLGYLLVSNENSRNEKFYSGVLFLAFGVGGVVCSHVISTVLILVTLTFVSAIDCIISQHRWKIIKGELISAFLCLLLCSWYILPMLEQLHDNKFYAQFSSPLSHDPQNIFSLFVPMHFSILLSTLTGKNIPLSEIGGAPVIVLLFLAYLFFTNRVSSLNKKEKILLWVYIGLCVLMVVDVVWIPVEKVLGFIQFTWRIYFIAALAATGFIIRVIMRFADEKVSYAAMILSIISAIYVLTICFAYFFARDTLHLFGNDASSFSYSSETTDILYIPQTMKPEELSTRERVVTVNNKNVEISYVLDDQLGAVQVDILRNETDDDIELGIPFIMYKGYTAYDIESGVEYALSRDDEGFVKLIVPGRTIGKIDIRYKGTNVQRISLVISLLAILLLVSGHVIKKRSV